MKPSLAVYLALTLYLMSACQSSPASQVTSAPLSKTGELQELEGTWVGHDKGGFTLIKIKVDSTGTYTRFTDREKEIGAAFPADRYYFYESDIKVSYEPEKYHKPKVAVYTTKFRFDYYLHNDTLFEYDKMGLRDTLVRIKPKYL